MINLLINDPFVEVVNAEKAEKLEKAAVAALQQQGQSLESELAIVIEDDEHLHTLNQEFLGIDAPTDVLSFPSGEEEADPDSGQPYLGDIIISYPRALEQASTAGHDVIDELQLLVVHGVLHLLGHDHAEPEEKAEMWAAQTEILTSLQVKLTRLPD